MLLDLWLSRPPYKQIYELVINGNTRYEFNKNGNAVDQACQELEGELPKLHPEGGKITQS